MGKRSVYLWAILVIFGGLHPTLTRAQSSEEKGAGREQSASAGTEQQQSTTTSAQEDDVDTMVVIGSRSQQELGNVAQAVTMLDAEEISKYQRTTGLAESLKRVPGLIVRDQVGGSTRVTISIRGVGAATNSGLRGVRLLVDGIPKNNAGGSGQDFVNLDLASADRIEVIRGPASAQWGNQSGGVINIMTKEGPPEPFLTYRQTVGSFDFFQERLQAGGQAMDGDLSYYVSLFRNDQDGFREGTDYFNNGFHSKFNLDISDKSELMMTFAYDELEQLIPAALTAEEMAEDRTQLVGQATLAKLDEFRSGVTYTRRNNLFDGDRLEFSGYYVPREIPELVVPSVIIDQFFVNRGAQASYSLDLPFIKFMDVRLTGGIDFQDTPLKSNLSFRSGGTFSSTDENARVWAGYFITAFDITDKLTFNFGGRVDKIEFEQTELARPNQETVVRNFSEFNINTGVAYDVLPSVSAYFNYGEAFQAPIIGNLRDSPFPGGEGILNTIADPQEVESFELGARGQLLDRINFETAVFYQKIDNFFTTPEFERNPENPVAGDTFTALVNAGEVEQWGFELGAGIELPYNFSLDLTYAYSDFEFEKFRVNEDDFAGNELPGIPDHSLFADLGYRHKSGFNASLTVSYIGDVFADNANTQAALIESYTKVDLRAGFENWRLFGIQVEPFISINNILDEKFVSQPNFNATQGRFFNPSPDRNAFGGLSVTFE